MLSKPLLHGLHDEPGGDYAHRKWYRRRRTWRIVLQAIYYPAAILIMFLVIWMLAHA